MAKILQRFNNRFLGENFLFCLVAVFLLMPFFCFADVVISEIMYDLPDSDTGREWIEITNSGSGSINIPDLKFFEANTNHGITLVSGNATINGNQCAIISDDPAKFSVDYPNFSGNLFKASFSLSNTSESLALKQNDVILDSISYSKEQGATGDGNSLHRNGGNWSPGTPSPGVCEGSSNQSGSNPPPTATTTENNNPPTTTTPTSQTGSTSNHPVEPQIFAFIDGDKGAIVGVDSIFRGSTIGLDKKPIEGARYFWSFGDGTTKEGQTVSHTWLIPGNYLVILEASAGEFNSGVRQKVLVTESGFSIEKVETGASGFIVIKNSLSSDVNISRWILRSAGKIFTFPSPTIILAGASVPFINGVTNLEPDPNSTELFYPNGTLAVKFEPKKEATKFPVMPTVAKKETKIATLENSSKLTPTTTAEIPILGKEGISSSTVIYTASVGGSSSSYMDWLLALVGVIGIGALGVIFSRDKKGGKTGEINQGQKPLTADDFEIIEEKE